MHYLHVLKCSHARVLVLWVFDQSDRRLNSTHTCLASGPVKVAQACCEDAQPTGLNVSSARAQALKLKQHREDLCVTMVRESNVWEELSWHERNHGEV